MDFFKLEGQYDLIIEQTFFCAIDRSLRVDYAKQVDRLLKPNSKLVGLMFDDDLGLDHPPYGGSIKEYKELFKPFFHIEIMERANDSIKSRDGREIWVKMVKK